MGYLTTGKILRIDLTNQTITTDSTARYEEKFIGGKGIGVKILYDEIDPKTDALDPGNALIFTTGALTGTPCPGAGRTHILAKSPISQHLGTSDVGGFWGAELKFAGYDAVVVKGKAEKPVYIAIDNERVEIRDAGGVWGRDTLSTQAAIRQELNDPDVQVFCIGPAGEKLVRYATIAHGINSAASRTGLGAVMGSKNLKAIAVRGIGEVKLADPKRFLQLCKAASEAIRTDSQILESIDGGKTKDLDRYAEFGLHAASNFQRTVQPGETFIDAFARKYGTKTTACFSCPIACRINFIVPGLHSGAMKCAQHSPLYLCNCTDPILNYEAAILCTEGGLDAVQVSNVLSWVMELYQRAIITEKDTDGIVMEWGDGKAAIEMIKKIIAREGIGDVLAENYLTVAKKFGKSAEDFFIHTKGVALLGTDIRGIKGSALAGAVSTRGDFVTGAPALEQMATALDALEGEAREQMQKFADDLALQIAGTTKALIPTEYKGKAAAVKFSEDDCTIIDTLGGCRHHSSASFMPMTPEKYAELYSAGKGIELTLEVLMEAAHRIHTLERAYCVREGLTRDDDTLPRRFLQEPVPGGPFKGEKIDPAKLEEMKTEYYALRGWNPATGVPTQETLKKLGLNDVAKDLGRGTKGKNVE
jgi:aldehyde:ferredoxin oxidoreductase